jgi:hypothetical protein
MDEYDSDEEPIERVTDACRDGDLGEVQRLLGEDPSLINGRDACEYYYTPLMVASERGHVEVVRWLVDQGADVNEVVFGDETALTFAIEWGHVEVVRLLVERGADLPSVVKEEGDHTTPLILACEYGHRTKGSDEMVRFLLGFPSVATTIDHRDFKGATALWHACSDGRGDFVRLLLERGADPTIAAEGHYEFTPLGAAIRRFEWDSYCDVLAAQSCWECVTLLQVRPCPPRSFPFSDQLTEARRLVRGVVWCGVMQPEMERGYLLCKARQLHDAAASFAAPVPTGRTRGKKKRRRIEAVPENLRRRVAPGGQGLPDVWAGALPWGDSKAEEVVAEVVYRLKPDMFEELMELLG